LNNEVKEQSLEKNEFTRANGALQRPAHLNKQAWSGLLKTSFSEVSSKHSYTFARLANVVDQTAHHIMSRFRTSLWVKTNNIAQLALGDNTKNARNNNTISSFIILNSPSKFSPVKTVIIQLIALICTSKIP